ISFGDGAARVGSPKVSTSSPLVSPSSIINVPRELYSIDVAATFRVPLTTVGDLQKLINDMMAVNYDELLSELTNEDVWEILGSIGILICNSIKVARTNADVTLSFSLWTSISQTSYDGCGLVVQRSTNVNSNFRTLVVDPVFDGVTISIPRKVVEKAGLEAVLVGVLWLIVNLDSFKKWGGLVDVVTIGIHLFPEDVFINETICVDESLLLLLVNVLLPNVEKTNDGFQRWVKRRRGKSMDPMLKTTGTHDKKDNLSMSNSFSALNDERMKKAADESKMCMMNQLLIQNHKAVEVRLFTTAAGLNILAGNIASFAVAFVEVWVGCLCVGVQGYSGGNGKGLTKKYFIDHLGTRHFKTNDLKVSYKDRVTSDFSLFSALDYALHLAGIWLCGECFCTHTFSKNCKHTGGVVVSAPCFKEVAIIGILVPPRPDLSVVDSTSPGTLPTDSEVLMIGGPLFPVHSLGAEHFCGALDNVRVKTRGFGSVWVQLLILPCCVLSTFVPTNRAQRRSGERERCQFESISRAILRWKDPVDRLGLVSDRLAELTPSFSGVKKSNKHDEANVVQCKRKPGRGHFYAVLRCSRFFWCGLISTTPTYMSWRSYTFHCTPPLYLSSASLVWTPSSVYKRLGASPSIGNSINTYLHDFSQFGVGIPGGCEAVVHSVNRLIESKGNEVGLSMLLVDFKNAFNPCRWVFYLRKTGYDAAIFSLGLSSGVQQGDPLGPLLFALALHPLVQTINQSCELTLQAWYLDDDTIVGDTLMVAKALDIIKTDGRSWTCSPVYLLEAQVQFDHALRASLEKIVTASGPGFGETLASMPFLAIALPNERPSGQDIDEMALNPKLMPSCNAHRIGPWGRSCWSIVSSEVGVQGLRHNLVRDILVDICSKVGIMVRKEAPMGFLSDDGKDLRPADLLLFNWL
ncbi:hypothetical protein Tco_0504976, partial [Tanacetum coccineum]